MSRHLEHRADGNQAAIVKALRDVGVRVAVTSQVGGGFPDLVFTYNDPTLNQWITGVMEVKMPGERFTPAEQEWWNNWPGWKVLVHTVDEAIAAVGVLGEGDGR